MDAPGQDGAPRDPDDEVKPKAIIQITLCSYRKIIDKPIILLLILFSNDEEINDHIKHENDFCEEEDQRQLAEHEVNLEQE